MQNDYLILYNFDSKEGIQKRKEFNHKEDRCKGCQANKPNCHGGYLEVKAPILIFFTEIVSYNKLADEKN